MCRTEQAIYVCAGRGTWIGGGICTVCTRYGVVIEILYV